MHYLTTYVRSVKSLHGTLVFLNFTLMILLSCDSLVKDKQGQAHVTEVKMSPRTPVAAIFDSFKGSWRLRRSLSSILPDFPSGVYEGMATFQPRESVHATAEELLYSEHGELKTHNGLTLKANRKYIYRYNPDEEKISAWFVKEHTKHLDGKEEVDYLFHDIETEHSTTAWIGRGEHLCELDMYWCLYEFRMPKVVEDGQGMNLFGVRYKVKGPHKDYTSDTAYERTFSADLVARRGKSMNQSHAPEHVGEDA